MLPVPDRTLHDIVYTQRRPCTVPLTRCGRRTRTRPSHYYLDHVSLNRFTEAEGGATLCAVTPFTRGETPNNYGSGAAGRGGGRSVTIRRRRAGSVVCVLEQVRTVCVSSERNNKQLIRDY